MLSFEGREGADRAGVLEIALPNKARVWVWSQEPAAAGPDLETGTVSQEEADRVARMITPKMRQHRRAEFATRRKLIAEYLQTPPEQLQISAGDNGEPALPDYSEVAISFSNSGRLCAAAIQPAGRIGVDVEVIRPIDWEGMLGMICSLGERAAVLAMAAESPDDALSVFFRLWTVKEAALKYTGQGFQAGAKSVRIPDGALAPACQSFRLDVFGKNLLARTATYDGAVIALVTD